MHEHGLIKDLVREVERVAAQEDIARITALDVWIGAEAHMSEEMVRDHFRHASKGSLAEGAVLNIELSSNRDDPHAAGIMLQSIEADS